MRWWASESFSFIPGFSSYPVLYLMLSRGFSDSACEVGLFAWLPPGCRAWWYHETDLLLAWLQPAEMGRCYHSVGLFSEEVCGAGSALLGKQYLGKPHRLWIFVFTPVVGNNLTPSGSLSLTVACQIWSSHLIFIRTDRLDWWLFFLF